MTLSMIYGLTVVVMYSVFIVEYKKRHGEPSAYQRLTTVGCALVWPLTISVGAAVVFVAYVRRESDIVQVENNRERALVWLMARPDVPVILHDIHGAHMMKARDVSPRIRGGVSPSSVTVYALGMWEPLDIQEVREW